MKKIIISLLLTSILLFGCAASTPTETPAPFTSDLLTLDSPLQYAQISSPLEVTGKAKGSMYFEGQFAIDLTDSDGNVMTSTPAIAEGEWTTEDFVPFKSELTFMKPTAEKGFIVFKKDNPSGLPENDLQYKVVVYFE